MTGAAPAGAALVGEAAALYRGAPLRARAHVALRARLFPFAALLPFAPETGRAVDLGCGHGLWCLALARARPGLAVVGVDPDGEKVALGQAAAAAGGLRNVTLSVGRAEDVDPGPCDLLSLVDVLYLVPNGAQVRLLRRAVAALRPGGRLLLKEMSERPRWKFLWNRGQELLSVRLLRVTRGRSFHFRTEAGWLTLLGELGLPARVLRLDAGYLHPHLLIIAEKPA